MCEPSTPIRRAPPFASHAARSCRAAQRECAPTILRALPACTAAPSLRWTVEALILLPRARKRDRSDSMRPSAREPNAPSVSIASGWKSKRPERSSYLRILSVSAPDAAARAATAAAPKWLAAPLILNKLILNKFSTLILNKF